MGIFIYGLGVTGAGSRLDTLLSTCQLLAGGRRHLERYGDTARLHGAELFEIGSNLKQLVERINQVAPDGDILVLASGDSLFFGIGRYLINHLQAELGEQIEIVPGISIMQYAFARFQTSWDDAAFLSLHGRGISRLAGMTASNKKLFLFTDANHTPDTIAKHLIDYGLGNSRINTNGRILGSVIENAGAADERMITSASMQEIAEMQFGKLNVMLLENDNPSNDDMTIGLPEAMFEHRNGMITKAEVRAVVISKMNIKPDSVIWDIGAGSGSVSIESARIARFGRVWAIEKDDAEHIESNKVKFNCWNITIVNGTAPEAMKLIDEQPDIIFIGGSGGRLLPIIETAFNQIKPGGRVVMAIVAMETLSQATALFYELDIEYDMIQMSLSRRKKTGAVSILSPMTPVFIITIRFRL